VSLVAMVDKKAPGKLKQKFHCPLCQLSKTSVGSVGSSYQLPVISYQLSVN